MRYFRRLPPLLRVVSILGLLLPIASLALLILAMIATAHWFALSVPLALWDSNHILHILVIAQNLGMLGGACTFVVSTYSARFRQPDRAPLLLSSWQSQARTLALLAALPLCALALTLITPSDSLAFLLVMALSLLAAMLILVAYLWVIIRTTTSGPMRAPYPR